MENEPLVTPTTTPAAETPPVVNAPPSAPTPVAEPSSAVTTIPDDDKISVNDFEEIAGKPLSKDDLGSKKKEDKKVEPTPPPTKPIVEVKGKETTPPVIPSTQPEARDYTGLPDELSAILKKTDNGLYNHLKPFVASYRDAVKKSAESEARVTELSKGRPPENYNEHPQAFILSPQFASVSREVQEAGLVYNHWAAQMDAVENGALKYNSIVRDANGQLVMGPEIAADASAKSKLLRNVNWAQGQLQQREAKVAVIQESHKTNYEAAKGWLAQAEQDWFTVVNNENNPLQPMIKSTLDSFPKAFQSNPMARPLAKSLTLNVRLAELVKTLQENGGKVPSQADTEAKRLAAIKKQELEAGPTASSSSAATAPSKAKDEDVTMDDFEKVIQEG